MAKSKILGADGKPIELALLDEEIATGGLTSVRQVWVDSIARGLTPARLTSILERSARGDADDYLTLAEEMEERDPHYASVLGTRKRAVSSLPITVEAASDSAEDQRNAEFIEEMKQRPEFPHLVEDLLDGLGKGYSAVEIVWKRGAQWIPEAFEHRDPRWFRFDEKTGRELRLRDAVDPVFGIPLPAFKFIVHKPRIKSGLQVRSGLARLCAFSWICKAYALKDWLAFAEVFGLPFRLGRYGPGASRDDVNVLKRAVAAIGSDAAAVLPESMKIEFITGPQVGGGNDLFRVLSDWLDRQMSKAVLGQTSTSDAQSAGLGSNQANVHNDVRGDIQAADVRDLAATLNRDLVRAAIDLNFGPQKAYPRICFHVAEPEDLKGLADSLEKLVPLGLEVEQSVIRDKFGLPEPAAGAKLLGAPRPPAPVPQKPLDPNVPALNRRLALNADGSPVVAPVDDATAAQNERLAREADATLQGWLASVRTLLEQVQSLEEFRDRLIELYPQMPVGQFSDLMGDALAAAELAGRYDILDQAGLVR